MQVSEVGVGLWFIRPGTTLCPGQRVEQRRHFDGGADAARCLIGGADAAEENPINGIWWSHNLAPLAAPWPNVCMWRGLTSGAGGVFGGGGGGASSYLSGSDVQVTLRRVEAKLQSESARVVGSEVEIPDNFATSSYLVV